MPHLTLPHAIAAYSASPTEAPKGAVLVLHEAFGVTPHIQRMADWFASHGYLALAPDLFAPGKVKDEIQTSDAFLSHTGIYCLLQAGSGLDAGRALINATPLEHVEDVARTALAWFQTQHPGIKVAAVGYCWGGSMAYYLASKVEGFAASDCYYGAKLAELSASYQPLCPAQIHLAELDRYIPRAETQAALHHNVPHVPVYVYPADHGFNRDDGRTYNPEQSQIARDRTLSFLSKHL